MQKIVLFLLVFTFSISLQAQDKFLLTENKVEIPFQLINNLIILKVTINHSPVNLVFDTGAKQTILINLKPKDSVQLRHTQKKLFTGVGGDYNSIEGLVSRHNRIQITHKIVNDNATVYLITNYDFKFSEIIGITINGFIGGELIKDYIVKIDYKRKKMIFYKHEYFNKKLLKRYRSYPIEIIRDKPYIFSKFRFRKNMPFHNVKLLIDTGNGDSVWFFENDSIKIPKHQKTVDDYFGFGLGGEIVGKRTKTDRFQLDDKYRFKNVYPAVPKASFVKSILARNPFDGIIGNEILRRFYIVFDYKNHKMYLKKYRKNYRESFVFNNSGIFLAHQGKIYVKYRKEISQVSVGHPQDSNYNVDFTKDFIYQFKLVDRIVVHNIRKNSPADKAGLVPGDVLLEINGKNVYNYKLYDLDKKFFYHNIKKLDLLINRNGIEQHIIIDNAKQL